jgi:hypothetical protein
MGRVGKVKYKINFQKIFGSRVPDDQEFKEKVVQAVIDRIVERTQDNVSIHGKPFAQYSDAYAKKKGVAKGDVDLTLSGDMLAAIDVIDSTAQTVTIGFPDETENAKAWNHMTGDTVKKREFFGLPQKELEEIARSFSGELEDIQNSEREGRNIEDEELEDVLRSILSGELDEELGI